MEKIWLKYFTYENLLTNRSCLLIKYWDWQYQVKNKTTR